MSFLVSPVISAVGSPSFVTLTFGDSQVRVSGDESSLEKFLAVVHPPDAAPAPVLTGKLGYRCVFGGKDGYIPVNVNADAPGITTTQQIAQLEADISQRVGSPVVMLSWQRVEISPAVRPEIVQPDAVGAPGEPIPADDEQGPVQ